MEADLAQEPSKVEAAVRYALVIFFPELCQCGESPHLEKIVEENLPGDAMIRPAFSESRFSAHRCRLTVANKNVVSELNADCKNTC